MVASCALDPVPLEERYIYIFSFAMIDVSLASELNNRNGGPDLVNQPKQATTHLLAVTIYHKLLVSKG